MLLDKVTRAFFLLQSFYTIKDLLLKHLEKEKLNGKITKMKTIVFFVKYFLLLVWQILEMADSICDASTQPESGNPMPIF